ncbi:MAG: OsmC family protein [Deltaproteobacteria bacterium]|nr:OsmC family protein [Deltaproteobacteria bacterium]
MPVRTSSATWNGTLKEGNGEMKLGSGKLDVPFSWATRFGDTPGTNPEELIGAASAGCFSMFFSALLTKESLPPKRVSTTAKVHLEDGPTITKIELSMEAEVPGIDDAKFQELAATAKARCPVSKALGAVDIQLVAKLV